MGINKAVEVWCDDGNLYVVKGRQVGAGLVPEVLVTVFGKMLVAPVAEGCLIDVPQSFIDSANEVPLPVTGKLRMATWEAGLAYGSRHLGNEYEALPPMEILGVPENRERYARLAVLFGWIGGREPEYFYRRSDPRVVVTVDHGHFLGGQRQGWSIADLTNADDPTLDPTITSAVTFTGDELGPVAEVLRGIDDASIAQCVATCPDAWGITHGERITLCRYLATRRDKFSTALLDLSHPGATINNMVVTCPDCDAVLVPYDQHEDHISPAGARYWCADCGARWERDASGMLRDVEF